MQSYGIYGVEKNGGTRWKIGTGAVLMRILINDDVFLNQTNVTNLLLDFQIVFRFFFE